MTRCPICDKEFRPNGSNRIYCSRQCRRKAQTIAYRKKHPLTWKEEERKCSVCGAMFLPVQKHQEYCSHECKNRGSAAKFKRENPKYWAEYRKKNSTSKKIKTKKKRICRNCGAVITNGNWWYCHDCHREMSRELDHPDHVYPIMEDLNIEEYLARKFYYETRGSNELSQNT